MPISNISSAQLYTHPESLRQIMPQRSVMLVLLMAGFEYFKIVNPAAGKLLTDCQFPSLVLVSWPLAAEFKALSSRKNWAILSRIPQLEFCTEDNLFHYQHDGSDLTFSGYWELSSDECDIFAREFSLISSYLQTATVNTLFAAQAILTRILSEMICNDNRHTPLTARQQAAYHYKQLIDHDKNFRVPLTELAKKCNYSLGHLRKLFEEYYQISPVEYRAKLRLARIEEMLIHTQLSPKEIADTVGMNHVTHLYSFLKAHHRLPPGKALKRK